MSGPAAAGVDASGERRGEDIDAGLHRLGETLAEVGPRPVERVVDHALTRLRLDTAADDVAAMAIRWTGAG